MLLRYSKSNVRAGQMLTNLHAFFCYARLALLHYARTNVTLLISTLETNLNPNHHINTIRAITNPIGAVTNTMEP